MVIPVGIIGYGTYFPERVEKAAHLVEESGIPEDIFIEKMGIRQRHVAAPDELPTEMAAKAARKALTMAGLDPEQIIFCFDYPIAILMLLAVSPKHWGRVRH